MSPACHSEADSWRNCHVAQVRDRGAAGKLPRVRADAGVIPASGAIVSSPLPSGALQGGQPTPADTAGSGDFEVKVE